ncbi:MAG: MerR family transcriptional regulator [Acidobacteria bacterium]|nr:MerR family transcriptional regulator [Acidobacteriota bacterium]
MPAPKRELYKAVEVCEVAGVRPYVLRSWEAEFPQLGQAPPSGGARTYRREDVEMVLRIKSLVFGEGLTLAGARRRLEESDDGSERPTVLVEEVLGERARERVRAVRDGLRGILQMLSSDGTPTEFVLAASAPEARRGGKGARRRSA